MAWQNVFAVGDCAVEVWRNGSLIQPSDYPTAGITVGVSAAGLVTMTAPEVGGSGSEYEVRIVPSYSTQGRAVRLAVADTPDEQPGYDKPTWSVGDTGVDPYGGFDRPFVFVPKSNWVWAGYLAGSQGV